MDWGIPLEGKDGEDTTVGAVESGANEGETEEPGC